MKYAIMSDAHANPAALDTALADARSNGCGKYIFLGDMTGYGYDAKSVVERCMSDFDVVLLGNHDAVCTGLDAGINVMLNHNYDIDREQRDSLSEKEVAWIKERQCMYSANGFACVHGDIARNFFRLAERILFCGHSHHAAVWNLTKADLICVRSERRLSRPAVRMESVSIKVGDGGKYIVNVGSVGYPRSDFCIVYCIYDDEAGVVTFRRLPFDFAGYIEAMISHGHDLPIWLARWLASI